jgi:hypothetical protein
MCAGCGGGSSNNEGTGGGGGTPAPQNVPTISSIAPSSVNAGSPPITITLYGTNFEQGATVKWNAAKISTSWVSATTLTATVPAENLTGAGSAQIVVSNLEADSTSRTFTISAPQAPGTWIRVVPGITDPKQMVFDTAHGKLYVSMPSGDQSAPNTIIPVDPVSGAAGTPVPAGKGPNLMSIASDNSYLWVALDDDGVVQRFALPGLTKDITVTVPQLGGLKHEALSLEAARVNPRAMALVAGMGTNADGVYVFDDATQRPHFVPGLVPPSFGPAINWIEWGANDSVLYGGGMYFFKLDVDAAGASYTWPPQGSSLLSLGAPPRYDKTTGLLYSNDWVYDPERNMQVGIYGGGGQGGVNLSGGCGPSALIPSLGRRYCILLASYENPRLLVFDQHSYAFLNEIDLGTTITGTPLTLIPWGKAGLALLTTSNWPTTGDGRVFLIDGAAINPNAPPDVTTGAAVSLPFASMAAISPQGAAAGGPDVMLTIKGSGFTQSSLAYSDYGHSDSVALPTTYVSANQLSAVLPASAIQAAKPLVIMVWDEFANRPSTNSLIFTVNSNAGATQLTGINLSGLSLAWDPANSILYAGTSMFDAVHPNSIVGIDPNSGAIVASATVSPEPVLLDIASDHGRLFVSYVAAQAMSEVPLPGLTPPVTWPLIDPQGRGPYFAGDMKAAPDSPATSAVTLFTHGYSPAAQGGVVVFDDDVARPDFAPGWTMLGNPGALYDTLAWSNSNTTLAAANNESDSAGSLLPFYALDVYTGGVAYGASYQNLNETSAGIHSDFGTGLIYSDDGVVGSPFDGSIRGSYGASGLVVPDSSTQHTYILGQTLAQQGTYSYTVQSFNQSTFVLVGSITLPNLTGAPFKMIRWGSSGLAILVYNDSLNLNNGPETLLYIVKDTSFVSNAQPGGSASALAERVQARWPRRTPREIVRRPGKAMAPPSE